MATLQEVFQKAQAAAPSYYRLADDGAPAKCDECGSEDQLSNFIMTFTPNGKNKTVHLPCVDEWWIEHATDLGIFPL